MNRKIPVLLVMTVLALLALSACSTVKQIENMTSTTALTNEASTSDADGQTETAIYSPSSQSQTETTSTAATEAAADSTTVVTTVDATSGGLKAEELEKLPDYPSYWFAWALEEEGLENSGENPETIEYFTYDGKPVTVFCRLLNVSSEPWEFGLFIEVDGVLQKTELNGTTSDLHRFELQPLETVTVKMSFVPDIGEKGEIRSLSCAVLVSPSYVAKEDGDYGVYLEPGISGNFPLVMNSDSSKNADTTDNPSLYKVSPINRIIYSVYEDGNNLESFENYPLCYIYEDLSDYIKKEDGAFVRKTKITTKASQNSRLIMNLHGKAGTYRVSFYLNGERLNAFDGKGYLEVTIGEKQQAEIPVTIDTRKLKGANRIEAYYKEINCDFTQESSIIASSSPQKYIVR